MLFLASQLQNTDAIFISFSPKLAECHEPSGIAGAGYSRAPRGYTHILEGPTHSTVVH